MPAGGAAVTAACNASGASSMMSQLSVMDLPALTPPCTSKPPANLASMLRSKPSQCARCLPNCDAALTTFLGATMALGSKIPPTVCPPFGRRVSVEGETRSEEHTSELQSHHDL